jgi:NAD(P)-dependent dehydrogenase (short-subunit alcohol dehydrogenase family)
MSDIGVISEKNQQMLFSLKDKTAIVTGGASGIGLAISKLFAGQGATVHILELNHQLAEQEAASITSAGGKAFAHSVNIAEQEEVKKVITEIAGNGSIDILVNNAGIAHIGNADNTEEADFDKVVAVNIKGTYNCLHSCIPYMKEQGKGVILNIASVASSVGIPDRFAYSMSKGAVVAMTLSVAKDYIKSGIRCNCISPARVHTPFVDGFLQKNYPGKEKEMFAKLAATQPIGRMAEPAEIAALALYLCSDEAGFTTGCDYPIDGGFIKLNN